MHHLTPIDNQYYIQNHPNKFVRYGAKCYSQSDEDGITLEIVQRVFRNKAHFLEIGVGDGTECNTLVLAALGWTGEWIGNETLAEDIPIQAYTKEFVTVDNISNLLKSDYYDLVSIDIDGNDYHVLKEILQTLKAPPSVIIVEYNAKFIPPIEWVMPYSPHHSWDGIDYFGASLQSYVNLLSHSHFLVACNAVTGGNAFFVSYYFEKLFNEVKLLSTKDIYVPPRYRCVMDYNTHPFSTKTIYSLLTNAYDL